MTDRVLLEFKPRPRKPTESVEMWMVELTVDFIALCTTHGIIVTVDEAASLIARLVFQPPPNGSHSDQE